MIRKGLKRNIFSANDSKITLNADIKEHAAWGFRHIYSVPYPEQGTQEEGIARFYHGIQHVSRAAMYTPILANLYRRHGHQEALQLTNEQLKLIQIAILFHDAAREGEEEDLWDHESATFLYSYLTLILEVPQQQAKKLAEAVANKDWSPGEDYYVLHEVNGEIAWSLNSNRSAPRNIYQKLIHDADCLDIIRARDKFNGRNLDFYKEVASIPQQKQAFDEMAELIAQARSLIEIQGDGRRRTNAKTKNYYENTKVYSKILQDIHNGNYAFFTLLYANGKLLSTEQLAKLTLIDTNNILNHKTIFARGIIMPSALARRHLKERTQQHKPISDKHETLAELEFRKVKRRKGVLTNTSKADGLNKEGNPNRSVSLLGYGGGVFADAGCLIFNPDRGAIKSIFITDVDSGWGKKKDPFNGAHRLYNNSDTTQPPAAYNSRPFQSVSSTPLTLDELKRNLKLGGSARLFKGYRHPATHTEILYDVQQYDAIYYTFDPTLAGEIFHGSAKNAVPYSPILKAIFLQYEYNKAFGGKMLPIYEYSGIHHYLKKAPTFTDEQIIQMWVAMCSCYLKDLIKADNFKKVYQLSIDAIQWNSMYPRKRGWSFNEIRSASTNYPEYLQQAVAEAIEEKREQLIEQHILSMIYSGAGSLIEDDIYNCIYMRGSSQLLAELKPIIEIKFFQCMQNLPYDLYLPNEKCRALIRIYKLAEKAGLNINAADQNINDFILRGLSVINQDKASSAFNENLFNMTRIACYLDILPAVKSELSKFNCHRWLQIMENIDISSGLLSLSDLATLLISTCKLHGPIDLNYLNVLEILNGSSNRFLFLNSIFNDLPSEIQAISRHLFKPASNPSILNTNITKHSLPLTGYGTFFQPNKSPKVRENNHQRDYLDRCMGH